MLRLVASSGLSSSSLIRPVISNCLRLLSDLDCFACVEDVSPCRFRFCPDEEDRRCWLIPSPLNMPLVTDWLSLNGLPVANRNVRGSPNSILLPVRCPFGFGVARCGVAWHPPLRHVYKNMLAPSTLFTSLLDRHQSPSMPPLQAPVCWRVDTSTRTALHSPPRHCLDTTSSPVLRRSGIPETLTVRRRSGDECARRPMGKMTDVGVDGAGAWQRASQYTDEHETPS
jgi:hypothetical protein